jgi:hypothetical protein
MDGKSFISLKTVFEHVEVGIFFLVFSLHTHLFQGGKIKSRQRFDYDVENRKGDTKESILPS